MLALFALWVVARSAGEPELAEPTPFDFAGGYPVPPMPGQRLPEQADVVHAEAERTDA